MTFLRLSVIALVLAQFTTTTRAAVCNDLSAIAGSYAFYAGGRGTDDGTDPKKWANTYIAIAGVMTFTRTNTRPPKEVYNASGTVTRMFTLSGGGAIINATANDDGGSGTWITDKATCSGTITFPKTPLGVETYRIFFTQDGNKIFFINSTSGVVLAGQMERQGPP